MVVPNGYTQYKLNLNLALDSLIHSLGETYQTVQRVRLKRF